MEIHHLLRPFVNLQSALVKRTPSLAVKPPVFQAFVKPQPDQKEFKSKKSKQPVPRSLFLDASDWQLRFDLNYDEKGLKTQTSFPVEIAACPVCPDVVIWSTQIHMVIWIELTVPWEENIDKAQLRKSKRYDALEVLCVSNGWKVRRFEIEVGARGYLAPSFAKAWIALGLPSKLRKELRSKCSDKALLCSYVLYLQRFNQDWAPRKPLKPRIC
jgi:hypothetical protein